MSEADRSEHEAPVTSATVLRIAIPMTLAYLTTPIVGFVDTAAIGQLGSAALIAAIAMGAIIFDFIFSTFNFLRAGTTGLVAQAYGAENLSEQRNLFFRGILLAVIPGLIVVVLREPILQLGIYLLGTSETVTPAVEIYFSIRALSTPFALVNYVILGWLIGMNRPGWALALQILLNGINAILDGVFVLVLDWGVAGVGWGTVIAEVTAAILGVALVWQLMGRAWQISWPAILDRHALSRMISVNTDIMIRTFCLMFAFAFFISQSQKYGDVPLAANSVLMQFFLIAGFLLDGLATSAEQLTGSSIGAGNRRRFSQAFWVSLAWNIAIATLCSVIFIIFGVAIVDFVTTAEPVRETAYQYLPYAIATPVAGVLAFHLDGVFMGATWTRPLRNMMLGSVIIYLICWQILSPIWGNHGLWIALLIFLAARGITLGAMVPRMMRASFAVAR